MNALIGGVAEQKSRVESGLQEVGRNLRRNQDQGQADLKSGKIGRYDTINPIAGTRTAFKKGYNK